ncbi:MAG: NAD+ synthase [Desulfobacteraceae bacterium]|nr:NAD+ synthase [Desulfobacteraceae bacterium]
MAQIDPLIGDFNGNVRKMCDIISQSRQREADLVVFPELALIGYPPRDLLEDRGFVAESIRYWDRIREASTGIGVIFGAVSFNEGSGKPYHNTAVFFEDGKLLATARKMLLPSYDVFDEERYFEPGKGAVWVNFRGKRIGLTICEDVWNVAGYLPRPLYHFDPVSQLWNACVDMLVNISASPFHLGKAEWTSQLLKQHAIVSGTPVVYVNQVGGNDELIFQGHSMILNKSGDLLASGKNFEEDLIFFDLEKDATELHARELDPAMEVIEALTLGVRDYAFKSGFRQAVLGLSGGVDSALTASLAVRALGAENVLGVGMPGPYNAPESLADARELASRLGIEFEVVPIGEMFQAALKSLNPAFKNRPPDSAEENLQARLRGMTLMALSNKFGRLLLNTGNKSEVAVGYCTLYGDMNGGLAVLGDVPKTMVYELSRRLNEQHGWIPENTLTRAPSAELRPDQTDQDSLPPYDVLDSILAAFVEQRLPAQAIVGMGFDPEVVRSVVHRIRVNEYKRWQAPPILRVTTKAFGVGRRTPLARHIAE